VELATWGAEQAGVRLAPLGDRWARTQGVASRAREIATVVDPADRELLIAAAYLHDVGYAPELAAHGFHPLDGALWLREQGLDRLASLVAHHSAARFEAEAQGLASELGAFEDEQSVVSDALTYSDLTTGPRGERIRVAERLREIECRYGSDSLVARALNDASDSLFEMAARTERRLARRPVSTPG
jgi:HD superfamily phosphodiesterase